MLKAPNIKILENLSEVQIIKNLDSITQILLKEIQLYLKLNPYPVQIKIRISKNVVSNDIKNIDIFNIGVNRYIDNNTKIIEIYENYLQFIPFILLREVYNLFIPEELKSFELVQIVVNQIILSNLSKSAFLNEWKSLIRERLEYYDLLTKGVNRLFAFDRLERFFKLSRLQIRNNPTQFFFKYIQKNLPILNLGMKDFHDEDIHEIFFTEFRSHISRTMVDDEIVEAIRCVIYIFYKVKEFRDILSYKKFFRKFNETGEIYSKLSQRKFTKNINWIKNYSYIAPSYQLNWNAINVSVVAIFLKFNPLLKKTSIIKVIEGSPFFISPKISNNSFAVEFSGYVILPKPYLDDFIRFLGRLKSFNYISECFCLLRISQEHSVNLNYFREYSQKYRVINPNHRIYDKKYEIEFKMNFGRNFSEPELSILDFLIIDRIRMFSVSGFGFERSTETLSTLKSDLINEITTQRAHITNLKKNLNYIYTSDNLKSEFLRFIFNYKNFGFFYLKIFLTEYLIVLNFMENIITNNPQIKTISDFQDFIKNPHKSHLIEDNIILNNKSLMEVIIRNSFSKYFKSKETYKKEVEKYKGFADLLNSFYNLKILNINTIKQIIMDKKLVNKIYSIKEERLEKTYKNFKSYQITNQEVNNIMDNLLNSDPPIIKPLLINTIITKENENDYLQLILTDSQDVKKILKQIKVFFPRILINYTTDLISNKNLVYVEISTPYLTKKEKNQLISIFHNAFNENLLYGKFFLWTGMINALSSKNFYDFDRKEFFYTNDLYRQYFLYAKSIFRENLDFHEEEIYRNQKIFWSKNFFFLDLVKEVNTRVLRENFDYNDIYLNSLSDFHLNMKEYLIDNEKFKKAKEKYFFANFIKTIKFIPSFENFGLEQYFLYLYPTNLNELDFKLLFLNTFQKIKYPASIDSSNGLFIKYIMPYGSPNLKYLHWLSRSKKIIREYCGFFINKMYKILHFKDNLSQEGWIYDKDKFKMHMQEVLFNPKYSLKTPIINEFETGNKSISSYLGPESPEFESLSQIYDTQSIDIKSFLATKKVKTINHITSLLKKNLIFPYLSLKNLDLHNIVYIIVPNLKKESIETVVKVFSFFNVATIYEIKGQYFIYGFKQEIQFPSGLMIKIKFPKCEISEFERLFDLLFEYLEIEHYIILNDLADGSNLIKSIYGGLDFLKSYNPLKNLEWNKKQKRWENPKVFTSKFEPIYPDLVAKDKK